MDYSSEEMEPWISQFCSMFGHDYFVEVAPEFIEDDFNLTGLSSVIPYYKQALDVILDLEPESPLSPSDAPLVDHAAELLYGLIHTRYILTKPGLHAMAEKYERNCFGSCPRYYCDGMHLIPIGRFDSPGIETVRLYCPNCNDIYLPSSSRYLNIDGAFFGTSFAGMFMKMFPEIKRQSNERTRDIFQLKLFGFRLNEMAPCGPRMKWLRQWPSNEREYKEFEMCKFGIPPLSVVDTVDADQMDEDAEDSTNGGHGGSVDADKNKDADADDVDDDMNSRKTGYHTNHSTEGGMSII